jgi:L-aspartate oxidase
MPNVRVHAHACATGLVLEDGRCAGVRFMREDGSGDEARARCTLIATGGAGQVFSETTNPIVATGDGIAIACRAGAAVADMEFVQFHPTALKVPGQPRFLLSEALRGEGARLVNEAGEAFMLRYDPAGDLAPRDRVARGIVREEQRTGGRVFLTLDRLEPRFVHERFPLIADACRRAGLDLATDRIPVGPAAHYLMGGVVTDVNGRTTIPGLFAAGEAACTGVHGANRLASNSLLEGLVFGARAGKAMREAPHAPIDAATVAGLVSARTLTQSGRTGGDQGAGSGSGGVGQAAGADIAAIRATMWERVGLFRDARGLGDALDRFGVPHDHEPSVLTVGRLIARAALRRQESRGGHYRLDFPTKDDTHWHLRVSERAGDTRD